MREVSQSFGVLRACQLGMDKHAIRRACDAGTLRRLRQGWYAISTAHPDVVAAVSSGGCLSCVSALGVYGVWTPPEGRLHVRFARHEQRARHRNLGCSYPKDLPIIWPVDEPRVAWHGVPHCLDEEEIIAVTDSALRMGMIDSTDLAALSRRLQAMVDPRAESGTESLVRLRLVKEGIRVRPQVVIPGVGRVDMLVGERLIIECDSVSHHTSLSNYRNDRRRDRSSLALGYITMRLTWEDVMFRWDEVLQDILAVVRKDRHRAG